MNHPTASGAGPTVARIAGVLTLLWLGGAAIRIPLLATPPIIPRIHDDLHMSETQVGLLVGLPLGLFALAAIPGSLLIARFGALFVAIAGLLICSLAAAARGAAFDIWTLYAATIVMGFGVSIVQPAMPTLARAWAPARIWLATTISTNGMLVGVALPPALSIPFVLPAVGGSWRLDLVVWAIPGLIAALLWIVAAPRPKLADVPQAAAMPRRWWPDWKSPQLWLLGFSLGVNNALFYALNAFIPDYLNSAGRGHLIGMTLGWMNGAQLLASLMLLTLSEGQQRRAWPFLVFGPISALGLFGIVLGDGLWVVVSAAVVGFAASITFVVTFGLPAVMAKPDEVHRLAGGMFTISYTIAVITPVICGAFWDLTGIPWTAFLPIGLCGVGLTVFGTVLTLRYAPK
jgi:CP family cyanate transporter-like MFS transporter